MSELKPGVDYPGVSVCFYCHDGNGKFLLHKRSTKTRDEHGAWDMGGGKLEFGEPLDEGVLREVREEYGCNGVIDKQLPSFSVLREHDGKKTHWVAVPFVVRVNPAEVRHMEPEMATELGWFPLSALPEPLHKGLRFVLGKAKDHMREYYG